MRISAPPLLPADRKAELEALTLARGLGAISPVDLVRHLQRLGLASDDVPADDYLSDLMSPDERTGLDSGHVALMAEVVSDLDDAEQLLERISETLPAELADDVASVVEAISDASSTLQADIPDYDETDDA